MYWILGLLLWFGCGVPAYGLHLAYFQQRYPEQREPMDVVTGLFGFFLGPIGLIVEIIWSFTHEYYGFQFIPQAPIPWPNTLDSAAWLKIMNR